MNSPAEKIVEAILNTGWGGDFGKNSAAYATIKLTLRGEYDRGHKEGREHAGEELEYIYSQHFRGCEHPHTGTVSLILELLRGRLDLI